MATDTQEKQLMKYEEVAEYLNVSKKTVGRLVKAGDLAVVFAGARPRVERSELERYVSTRRQP